MGVGSVTGSTSGRGEEAVIGRVVGASPAAAGVALLCVGLGACSLPIAYDEPPPMPLALSPAEEANLIVNAPVRFVWTAVERADHYDFHVFDRETRDISRYYRAELEPGTVCRDGECAVTLSVALPYTHDHAWRVRAGNNAGKSDWTRTRFAMVNGSLKGAGVGPASARVPPMPEPLEPRGATLVPGAVETFVWSPSAGATAYDFHLFDRSTGSIVDEVRDLPAATVCQQPSRCVLSRSVVLPPGEGHAWRVRAINRDGRSGWTREEFSVGGGAADEATR